jgi:hypothetical protein
MYTYMYMHVIKTPLLTTVSFVCTRVYTHAAQNVHFAAAQLHTRFNFQNHINVIFNFFVFMPDGLTLVPEPLKQETQLRRPWSELL